LDHESLSFRTITATFKELSYIIVCECANWPTLVKFKCSLIKGIYDNLGL